MKNFNKENRKLTTWLMVQIVFFLFLIILLFNYNKCNDNNRFTMPKLNETERLAFNQKYAQYEGEKVKGSNVQALISMMIANNEDENLPKVELEVDGQTETNWGSYRGKVKSAGIYGIELEYTSGVVTKVKILTINAKGGE